MVACAPESESFVRIETVPAPLSAEQRYEVADRRAAGQSWEGIGVALRQRGAELRVRAEADPLFAKALRQARRELRHDGTADALKRLRRVANGEDDKLAVAASEVLTKHDVECRKDDTRRAADKRRAEVEMAKIRAKCAPADAEEWHADCGCAEVVTPHPAGEGSSASDSSCSARAPATLSPVWPACRASPADAVSAARGRRGEGTHCATASQHGARAEQPESGHAHEPPAG